MNCYLETSVFKGKIVILPPIFSYKFLELSFLFLDTRCKQSNPLSIVYKHDWGMICLLYVWSSAFRGQIAFKQFRQITVYVVRLSFQGNRVCSSAVNPSPSTPVTPTSTQTIYSTYMPTTAPIASNAMTTTPWNDLPQDWQYMYYPYFFMSDPCITNAECEHLMNSECRVGICECISGYSFDWSSQSCVPCEYRTPFRQE